MNIRKVILAPLFLTSCLHFPSAGYAGFSGLTHFSRANCVNNESMSWDGKSKLSGIVASKHVAYYQKIPGWLLPVYRHTINSGAIKTVLPNVHTLAGIKAIHWGEGNHPIFDFKVYGTHTWFPAHNPQIRRTTTSYATSCNLDQW